MLKIIILQMAVVLILISVLHIASVGSLEYVTVNTTLGPITGYKDNVSNSELHVFLGIPYAKPPVGNLRFKAPVPANPWNTTYNATSLSKSCPQIPPNASSYYNNVESNLSTNISEDCLYLNIWAPRPVDNCTSKAVMVWIYGGVYTQGSTSQAIYDGRVLATQGDVIVVTINYRLGIFGFIYFGTSDVPGNMGLMDQYMAIKWVYDNIGKFGGDPQRITIFGESAGGNSVAYQLLTNQPKYFTRAIMESTASNFVFGFVPPQPAKQLSLQYATTLGCSSINLVNAISCLRSLNVTFILSTIPYPNVVPTIDGVFLTTSPYQLSNLMGVQNIDILAGINVDEAYPMFNEDPRLMSFFKDNQYSGSISEFNAIVSIITNLSATVVNACLPEAYGHMTYNDSLRALVDLYTDLLFACQCQTYAEAFDMNGNTVYRYRFDYGGSYRYFPSWVGAAHGDEVAYVFGLPLKNLSNIYNKYEVSLAKMVIGYWTNFTKYGNPNGFGHMSNTSNGNTYWPRFTDDNQLQLIFNANGAEIGNFTSQSECNFWDSVYPALIANPDQYESLCPSAVNSSSTMSEETWSTTMPTSSSVVLKASLFIYCLITIQHVMFM